jgi:hypothetical protein
MYHKAHGASNPQEMGVVKAMKQSESDGSLNFQDNDRNMRRRSIPTITETAQSITSKLIG